MQAGFSLPGVLMGLSLVSYFMIKVFNPMLEISIEKRRAASDAHFLAEHIDAIRRKVTLEGDTIATGYHANTNWLKHTSCPGGLGTATEMYLRCDFRDLTDTGFEYSSTIVNAGGIIKVTTNYFDPVNLKLTGIGPRPDILNLIIQTVNGGDISTQTPANQAWFNISSNADGNLISVVSNEVSLEEWLRRDGSVLPSADFDWNDNAITNVSNLGVNGDVQARTFVDSDDPEYLVDPDGKSKLNNLVISEDIFIESLDGYLTNLIVHNRSIISQDGFVPEPTCPHGSPQIFGSAVSLAQNELDPLPIEGWEVRAFLVQGGWKVRARVYAESTFTTPPSSVVFIQTTTYCI